MTWDTLAPWMALAFTLALSILVPLFTQIANNCHQRKMQQKKIEHEERQEKRQAYIDFLQKVGSATTRANINAQQEAGAAVYNMYAYAPTEWWDDLRDIAECLAQQNYSHAVPTLNKLGRLISEELDAETNKKKPKKKRNKKEG